MLANDTDVDGDALTAVARRRVRPTARSRSTADGSFTYTPDADYNGTDSFTYAANDGTGAAPAPATVTIDGRRASTTRRSLKTTPTPRAEDTALTIDPAGVLANDTDADGDTLTASPSSDPAHGTLTEQSDGTWLYTPDADYIGTDSFDYTVTDGNGGVGTATVTIEVTSVNDAPVAQDDTYTTAEDTALTIDPAGVLSNDTDADGDTLSASPSSDPAHGTLTEQSDGTWPTRPTPTTIGTDTFDYTVSDGNGGVGTGTVTIEVTSVNDEPVPTDDAYAVAEDSFLITDAISGVLANDTDADGDVLAASLLTDVSHGTLTLNADGSFTYTPDADFVGTDTFDYTVHRRQRRSRHRDGDIEVTTVNDQPVAVKTIPYTTPEDTALTIDRSRRGVRRQDADGDTLSRLVELGSAHGTLTEQPDGTLALHTRCGLQRH